MALHIVMTAEQDLLPQDARAELSRALAGKGGALLLLPSFDQCREAQLELAGAGAGLTLAVRTSTPSAWARERWEVWGDGRPCIDDESRRALMRLELDRAAERAAGGTGEDDAAAPTMGDSAFLPTSAGMLECLCGLAREALPEAVSVAEEDDPAAGLTEGELRLCRIAAAYARRIHERGYLEPCEMERLLAGRLERQGVRQPDIVCCGFDGAPAAEQDLLASMARRAEVTFFIRQDASLSFGLDQDFARRLEAAAGRLGVACEKRVADGRPIPGAGVAPELLALSAALFDPHAGKVRPTGHVARLEPAGPRAEAEAVCREACRLRDAGARSIVASVPDVARGWRGLASKLAARGIRVRCALRQPASGVPAVQAFLGFARTVAQLKELDEAWPEPEMTPAGEAPRLGDMSWWPPRDLTDFLLSESACMDPAAVRVLDARWRSNRMLTPARVLSDLCRKSAVSEPVMRATQQLLRGRVGSAALELARGLSQDGSPHGEALQALALIRSACRRLGEQAITADVNPKEGAIEVALSKLVSLVEEALAHETLRQDLELGPEDAACQVRVATRGEAARMPARSADAIIVCGLTSAEYDLSAREDALSLLLQKLGLPAPQDPLKRARHDFACALLVPRGHVVLERALHDADAHPTYPAVVLSECLVAYGISLDDDEEDEGGTGMPVRQLGEELLVEEQAASGTRPSPTGSDELAPKGVISRQSRTMIVVPREGEAELPGGRPSLSASQIESYLECPYKWFAQRRLGLGSNDADFKATQQGSFVHRVLEVSRRRLALEAAVADGLLPQDAVPSDLAGLDAACIPGASVSADNLVHAQDLVSTEFDLHLIHQRQHATTLTSQSLVPHDESERQTLDSVRRALLSETEFERDVLVGFEPRCFELRFGGHAKNALHVDYAGADFVGSVDRVDVNAHGVAVVIDYKHKKAPGFSLAYDAFGETGCPADPGSLTLPRHVQSLIYAQVIRRMYPQLKVRAAVYLSTNGRTARDHELAGVADTNVADRLLGDAPSARRAARLVCGGQGQLAFEELLDETEDRIAEAIRHMLAGEIPAHPVDADACTWCPVRECEGRLR